MIAMSVYFMAADPALKPHLCAGKANKPLSSRLAFSGCRMSLNFIARVIYGKALASGGWRLLLLAPVFATAQSADSTVARGVSNAFNLP
jgi:hypothetical protein